MKLGFIGCGNMATAIIKGIINSNKVNCRDIFVYDISDEATNKIANNFEITVCNTQNEIVNKCDVVVLAVKPNILSNVLNNINLALAEKETLLISIAAGKSIEFIRSNLSHNNKIIRVMPNINAVVNEAISAYCTSKNITQDDKNIAELILSSIGQVINLDEAYFPLFSVLGGCSPAMVYMFIDSLARAGVKNGMKKDMALKVAAQAVYGSAKMIMESPEHPWELIDRVCSPGGTTIEAVTSLQNSCFESSIINAVDKAVEKDSKL